jgi:hypothetical protein
MRRISHEKLRRDIDIKLSVMPGYVKRDTGIIGTARDKALDAIMSAMSGYIVLAPAIVGTNTSMRQGKFGVDEPDPHPELTEEI